MVESLKVIIKNWLSNIQGICIWCLKLLGAKIEYTQNINRFFKSETPLMILKSLGNSYWIGFYFDKCEIECVCYLDNNTSRDNPICNGIKVLNTTILKEYKNRSIRVVFADFHKNSGILQLARLSRKYKVAIECISPHFKNDKKNEYNINRFLGFFRKKLLKGDIPTIFSNDCTAGRIYEALGVAPITPTINVLIYDDDYLKFCKNPEKYLKMDMVRGGIIRAHYPVYYKYDLDRETGILDDVNVVFSHNFNNDDIVFQWNQRKRFINYNKTIFIYSDYQQCGKYEFAKEFFELSQNKLYMAGNGVLCGDNMSDLLLWDTNYFFEIYQPIELHFDLIGWVNNIKSAKQEEI